MQIFIGEENIFWLDVSMDDITLMLELS